MGVEWYNQNILYAYLKLINFKKKKNINTYTYINLYSYVYVCICVFYIDTLDLCNLSTNYQKEP